MVTAFDDVRRKAQHNIVLVVSAQAGPVVAGMVKMDWLPEEPSRSVNFSPFLLHLMKYLEVGPTPPFLPYMRGVQLSHESHASALLIGWV